MKHHTALRKQSGDTLIEVLLAIAILSTIIVGAIAMMNRGHAIALDSLERSQVTAFMTEQSEILQYIRDSYTPESPDPVAGEPSAVWEDIVSNRIASTTSGGCTANARPFYLQKTIDGSGNIAVVAADFDTSTINEASTNFVATYAQPGDGMWIEAEMPAAGSSGVGYIDFHIKACWYSVGQGPVQEAKTIVRLYVP